MNKLTIREMIRNLMAFNLDAEFRIIDNTGRTIPITDFNFGWRLDDDGADRCEDERDIYKEKTTCQIVSLFENVKGYERGDNE